jgi:DNA processing protein
LATIPGIGARRIAELTSRFGTASAVFEATDQELSDMEWFSARALGLLRNASRKRALAMVADAARANQHLLVPSDGAYPAKLRSIPDPPPVLFVRGDLGLFTRPAVAIVGSRHHTRYGAETAAQLADEVVRAGALVISGMALGLDAVAQGAALDAGGSTIGVLGTGADIVYPRQNRRLFERVITDGALLTEHPPGDTGHHGAFPRRNRLISGLADSLVVVEAAEGSGTLITVTCALEQGRDVFAVPGPISSPTSRGTNRLLRDGAIPILEPQDLFLALGGAGRMPQQAVPPSPPCTLSPDEARVYDALGDEPRHVDELALSTGLPIGPLLGTLLGLEIGGFTEQLPGSRFLRRVR